jgi:hypothetical protein
VSHPSYKEIPELNARLLSNIKRHMHEFTALQHRMNEHWGMEDSIYRFYHHSFKVYGIQGYVEEMCKLMDQVDPKQKSAGVHEYHKFWNEIVAAGTGHQFEHSHNSEWTKRARPMIEAAMHAKYILDMIVKYGKELKEAPNMLPSGWASVLSVFHLR